MARTEKQIRSWERLFVGIFQLFFGAWFTMLIIPSALGPNFAWSYWHTWTVMLLLDFALSPIVASISWDVQHIRDGD